MCDEITELCNFWYAIGPLNDEGPFPCSLAAWAQCHTTEAIGVELRVVRHALLRKLNGLD